MLDPASAQKDSESDDVMSDASPTLPKLAIFGLGYVGLPSAAVFAAAGLEVVGVDVNQRAVDIINSGRAHIVEDGLDDLLAKVVGSGALRATTQAEAANVFAIAVPTPFKAGKVPDLKYVEAATRMIAPHLVPGNLVILESTSPVGSTEQISAWLAEERPDLVFPHQDAEACTINLAHCPERILPGKVLHEVVHNDRVVGGMTPACSQRAVAFYQHAVKGECHVTNARTAEMCKLSENAFRDVNIAFANELSLIADKLGVDVWELIRLTNKHPRVDVLRPGTGVGGHCIAVDPWFIVDSAPREARLIDIARRINDSKPHWVAEKVEEAAARTGKARPVVACLGLAYKPDVDDFRESPSVEVVEMLGRTGRFDLLVCEPFASELPHALRLSGARMVSLDGALTADVIVFLTAHSQFKGLATRLEGKQLVNPCGIDC
jgi:UDP-N-acetyl-D-mannosaminuronic acid dehydrogenase